MNFDLDSITRGLPHVRGATLGTGELAGSGCGRRCGTPAMRDRTSGYPCRDSTHYLVSGVSFGFVNFFSSVSLPPHSCLPRQALSASQWVFPASLSSSTFDVNATLVLLPPHALCAHVVSALTRTTSRPAVPQPHTALNRPIQLTSHPPPGPFQPLFKSQASAELNAGSSSAACWRQSISAC